MTDNDFVKTANSTISGHEIFGELLCAEEKQFLMERGVVKSFSTGQHICRQLERESSMYIILMGEVEVSEGENTNKLVLAHLGKGEVFGEISALFRMPRISNVLASKPSIVLEITGDIFEELIENNPTIRKAIIQRFGDRLIETALRSVSFLRHIPAESLSGLIRESSVVSVKPGNQIIQEGEQGDAMFIIVHGAARVSRKLNNQVIPVSILSPGDYFGEWSVITGGPRTATITALSHNELIRVERETLLQFIQDNPAVRDRIDQIAHARHDADFTDKPLSGDQLTDKAFDDLNRVLEKTGEID